MAMQNENIKCVMVIDASLPLGIISNTAAVMGVTIGKQLPETVGGDVVDKTGREHLGIIAFPIPILKGSREVIKDLRTRLYEEAYRNLKVVDFPIPHKDAKPTESIQRKSATSPKRNLLISVLPSVEKRKR